MGGFSLWHWIVVLIIVLVLFGRGRVSEIMGDFGKGIKSFKQGMSEEDTKAAAPPAQIPAPQQDVTATETSTDSASKPQ
jgi:sec-independent protein translocase protein TatA